MGDILFLAHRIPYPPNKGDKIRSWNMLKYLAARTRVHLGAFVDDPEDMEHAPVLKEICGEVMLRPLDAAAGRLKRAIRGLWKGEALSVALFNDPAMHAWVRETVKRHPVDGIFVYSSQMAPYALPYLDGRRSVMDFVDMDSDKWRQYAETSGWPKRWLYGREARLLFDFERNVTMRADASLFVSEAEASLFRKAAGSAAHNVIGVNNGVDLAGFNPNLPLPRVAMQGKPTFVFTGAMDYRPNIDAVVWFADEVWPLVRAEKPQAGFMIVGSKPTSAVQKLGERDGIVVTGRVEDIRPYIAGADVVVAPLRIARGIQNKVLEAMALAKPVVATKQAFEGIDAVPGVHLLVEDDPAAMARSILHLADNPAHAKAVGQAARRQAVARYDWATSLAIFDNLFALGAEADQRLAVP